MRFTAEHYFRVSRERLGQAIALYRLGNAYALSMYSAGVGVECLLRAFKLLRDPTFDEKHDLRRLFRASGILNIDPGASRKHRLTDEQIRGYVRDVQNAVNEVCLWWANEYRFASEDRLRTHLRSRRGPRSSGKGDLLKPAALQLLSAAEKCIDRGTVLWHLSSRS